MSLFAHARFAGKLTHLLVPWPQLQQLYIHNLCNFQGTLELQFLYS